MNVSALLKTSLLIAGSVSTQLSYTDPNPLVTVKEEGKYGRSDLLSRIYHWETLSLKCLVWASSILEIAVIWATQIPCYFSDVVLWMITRAETGTPPAMTITPLFMAGCLLQLSGFYVRRACFYTLGKQFTFALSIRDQHKLITVGPYSIVRHPSYTGAVMVLLGVLMVQFGKGTWWEECGPSNQFIGVIVAWAWRLNVASVVLMFLMRTGMEDAVLKEEFGSKWEDWARRTRYRLLPGLY